MLMLLWPSFLRADPRRGDEPGGGAQARARGAVDAALLSEHEDDVDAAFSEARLKRLSPPRASDALVTHAHPAHHHIVMRRRRLILATEYVESSCAQILYRGSG